MRSSLLYLILHRHGGLQSRTAILLSVAITFYGFKTGIQNSTKWLKKFCLLTCTKFKQKTLIMAVTAMSELTEVRQKAGRKGGIITASLHPRGKEYFSRIGKLGGRPRRLSYSEMMNGNGGNGK
jgi:general stress protein YciG